MAPLRLTPAEGTDKDHPGLSQQCLGYGAVPLKFLAQIKPLISSPSQIAHHVLLVMRVRLRRGAERRRAEDDDKQHNSKDSQNLPHRSPVNRHDHARINRIAEAMVAFLVSAAAT